MFPRITRVSRLHQHPSLEHFKIAHIHGSSARVSIDCRKFNLRVGAQVLYIPPDIAISQSVARSLRIDQECGEPMLLSCVARHWRRQWQPQPDYTSGISKSTKAFSATALSNASSSAATEQAQMQDHSEHYCRVLALSLGRSISHGVLLPFDFVVATLCGDGPRCSFSPDMPSTVMQALCFLPIRPEPQPLIDLVQNPTLLSKLLDLRVWMSKRLAGRPVSLHYDAVNDTVRFWDENAVAVPHGWWTMPSEAHMARELRSSSRRVQLLQPFADAVRSLARTRFGGSIDLFLRGLICRSAAVYFYEVALHGADSFVMDTKQFLRECDSFEIPIVPTVHVNRTLRSIVEEALDQHLPTLPFAMQTSALVLAPDEMHTAVQPLDTPKQSVSDSPRHTYNFNVARTSRDVQSNDQRCCCAADSEYSDQSLVSQTHSEESSASLSWRRTEPILLNTSARHGFSTSRKDTTRSGRPRHFRTHNGGSPFRGGGGSYRPRTNHSSANRALTDDNNAQSYDSGRHRYERSIQRCMSTNNPSGSEKRWDGHNEESGFGTTWCNREHERQVDWPRALAEFANLLATKDLFAEFDRRDETSDESREDDYEQCLGFAVQVYDSKDLNRLVRECPHISLRVGAQMLCERELLRRGGTIDI